MGHKIVYTLDEDCKIIKFIIEKEAQYNVLGNNLWQHMESINLIPGRSWQSMRERYKKVILQQLKMPQYQLSKLDIFLLKLSFQQCEDNKDSEDDEHNRDGEDDEGNEDGEHDKDNEDGEDDKDTENSNDSDETFYEKDNTPTEDNADRENGKNNKDIRDGEDNENSEDYETAKDDEDNGNHEDDKNKKNNTTDNNFIKDEAAKELSETLCDRYNKHSEDKTCTKNKIVTGGEKLSMIRIIQTIKI